VKVVHIDGELGVMRHLGVHVDVCGDGLGETVGRWGRKASVIRDKKVRARPGRRSPRRCARSRGERRRCPICAGGIHPPCVVYGLTREGGSERSYEGADYFGKLRVRTFNADFHYKSRKYAGGRRGARVGRRERRAVGVGRLNAFHETYRSVLRW
jgi:hypothetical protein